MEYQNLLNLIYEGKLDELSNYLSNSNLRDHQEVWPIRIKSLISRGKYKSAIKQIESKESLNTKNSSNVDLILDKSEAYIGLGKYKEANNILISLNENFKDNNQLKETTQIKFNLIKCEFLIFENQYDKAINILIENIRLLTSIGAKYYLCNSYTLLGLIYSRKGLLNEAENNYKIALRNANELGNITKKTKILNALGVVMGKKGHYSESLRYFKESNNNSSEFDHDLIKSKINNNLSISFLNMGNIEEAIQFSEKAMSLINKVGNQYEKGKMLLAYGNVCVRNERYHKAMDHYNSALSLFIEVGNYSEYAKCMNNIGSLHEKMGNYEHALSYFNEGLNAFETINSKSESYLIHNNMGLAYMREGNYISAIQHFKKSIEQTGISNFKFYDVITKLNLGFCYLQIGNIDKASKLLNECRKSDQISETKESKAILYQYLGLSENMKGNDKEALEYLNQSLDIFNELNLVLKESENLFDIIRINLEMNNNSDVAIYFNKLTKINSMTDNEIITLRTKFAEILIYQNSNSQTDIEDILNLMEEIIQNSKIEANLHHMIIIDQCQLLLSMYKKSNDEAIIQRIQSIVDQLFEEAIAQDNKHIQFQTLIIKSEIHQLKSNYEVAENELRKAYNLSSSMKSKLLQKRVINKFVKNKLLKQYYEDPNSINDLLELKDKIKKIENLEDIKKEELELLIHDFMNSITVTENATRLIVEDLNVPSQVKDLISLLAINIDSVKNIVDKIIETSNFSHEYTDIEFQMLELHNIIDIKIRQYSNLIEEKNLSISLSSQKENMEAVGDEGLINRIIENLLHNAIKFSPNNSEIRIDIQEKEKTTHLSIINDSEPIPREYQNQLFNKYTKIPNTGSEGKGIGLYFTKQAVENMGGKIKLFSPIPGDTQGVKFDIELPRI